MTTSKQYPTKELLLDLLSYDSNTGDLYWNRRDRSYFKSDREFKRWNARHAGSKIISVSKGSCKEYRSLKFMEYGSLKAHRVIVIMHGITLNPCDEVDHVNGNGLDNRIKNLRVVTPLDNCANKKRYKNNTSGVTGISKRGGKWRARIQKDGNPIVIGTFLEKSDAIKARMKAEKELMFHKNHGSNRPL